MSKMQAVCISEGNEPDSVKSGLLRTMLLGLPATMEVKLSRLFNPSKKAMQSTSLPYTTTITQTHLQ